MDRTSKDGLSGRCGPIILPSRNRYMSYFERAPSVLFRYFAVRLVHPPIGLPCLPFLGEGVPLASAARRGRGGQGRRHDHDEEAERERTIGEHTRI